MIDLSDPVQSQSLSHVMFVWTVYIFGHSSEKNQHSFGDSNVDILRSRVFNRIDQRISGGTLCVVVSCCELFVYRNDTKMEMVMMSMEGTLYDDLLHQWSN